MAIATLTNIEKTFGPRVIFDKLSFSIDRGERVGLIGNNGSGKSTLFKVLTDQMPVDFGNVAVAKGTKIGHLTQDPVLNPENTVIDEAELAFSQLHDLAHKMRDLEHEMEHAKDAELQRILDKYQEVQHDFDAAGGYVWQHRLEEALLGVGLERKVWEQKVSTLSGGQRSRLALAKLLVGQNDLLLLDEPTNHLDLAAIAWLEDFLSTFSGAVLLVSHDRYLLDRVANRIVWLTGAKLKNYPGNYSSFVEQRALQELTQQREYEEQQADIAKQSEFIRRFGAGQRSKEAKGRNKRLQRLLASDQMVQSVNVDNKIRVNLTTDQRAGDRVLRVKELAKSYDNHVLWREISFEIDRGNRLGIIGPNGSGKTTLLEVMLGTRPPDAGEVRWGANLSIGYYDQRLGEFNPENTVAEEVRGDNDINDKELRSVLALMLFTHENVDKKMHLLSGGERARVAMAQLLIQRPNVLILDEPTNHLDILSCEALERALADFPGTILCVSHDRYFLDKVVTRLFNIEPPGIRQFDGNYSAWVRSQKKSAQQPKPKEKEKEQPKPQSRPKPAPTKSHDNPFKRPFGKLTVEQLEKDIAATERVIADCQSQFADPAVARDPQRNKKINDQYNSATAKLKQLEAEYFARQG